MTILLHILNALLLACESVLLILFSSKVLKRKFHPVLIFLALFCMQLIIYVMSNQFRSTAAFFILDCLVLLFCYRAGIGKKLCVITFFYASITISDLIAALLSMKVCELLKLPTGPMLQYPASFVARLLTFGIVYLFHRVIKTEDEVRSWIKYTPIPCVTMIVFAWVFPGDGADSDARLLLALICLFGFISNVVLLVLIQKSAEKRKLQYQLEATEEFKGLQAIYFRDLQATYQEHEKLVHDVKQHFDFILNAIDHETIIQYVKDLVSRNFVKKTRFTDNIDIDTILNAKNKYMREKGINLNVNVLLPDRIEWLYPVDVSIILGNALSNAIEACERCDGKEITLNIKYDDWILFSIENPTDSEPIPKKYGAGFMSSKGKGHGIGMESMETAVSRYDGHMEYRVENNTFRLDIMLQHFNRMK